MHKIQQIYDSLQNYQVHPEMTKPYKYKDKSCQPRMIAL